MSKNTLKPPYESARQVLMLIKTVHENPGWSQEFLGSKIGRNKSAISRMCAVAIEAGFIEKTDRALYEGPVFRNHKKEVIGFISSKPKSKENVNATHIYN